jgi:hypothetical protein
MLCEGRATRNVVLPFPLYRAHNYVPAGCEGDIPTFFNTLYVSN